MEDRSIPSNSDPDQLLQQINENNAFTYFLWSSKTIINCSDPPDPCEDVIGSSLNWFNRSPYFTSITKLLLKSIQFILHTPSHSLPGPTQPHETFQTQLTLIKQSITSLITIRDKGIKTKSISNILLVVGVYYPSLLIPGLIDILIHDFGFSSPLWFEKYGCVVLEVLGKQYFDYFRVTVMYYFNGILKDLEKRRDLFNVFLLLRNLLKVLSLCPEILSDCLESILSAISDGVAILNGFGLSQDVSNRIPSELVQSVGSLLSEIVFILVDKPPDAKVGLNLLSLFESLAEKKDPQFVDVLSNFLNSLWSKLQYSTLKTITKSSASMPIVGIKFIGSFSNQIEEIFELLNKFQMNKQSSARLVQILEWIGLLSESTEIPTSIITKFLEINHTNYEHNLSEVCLSFIPHYGYSCLINSINETIDNLLTILDDNTLQNNTKIEMLTRMLENLHIIIQLHTSILLQKNTPVWETLNLYSSIDKLLSLYSPRLPFPVYAPLQSLLNTLFASLHYAHTPITGTKQGEDKVFRASSGDALTAPEEVKKKNLDAEIYRNNIFIIEIVHRCIMTYFEWILYRNQIIQTFLETKEDHKLTQIDPVLAFLKKKICHLSTLNPKIVSIISDTVLNVLFSREMSGIIRPSLGGLPQTNNSVVEDSLISPSTSLLPISFKKCSIYAFHQDFTTPTESVPKTSQNLTLDLEMKKSFDLDGQNRKRKLQLEEEPKIARPRLSPPVPVGIFPSTNNTNTVNIKISSTVLKYNQAEIHSFLLEWITQNSEVYVPIFLHQLMSRIFVHYPIPSLEQYSELLPNKSIWQRDVWIENFFSQNPIMWDILEVLSVSNAPISPLLDTIRSLLANAIGNWNAESHRNHVAKHSPFFPTTFRLINIISKVGWLPSPLSKVNQFLDKLTATDVTVILYEGLWKYLADNPPTTSKESKSNSNLVPTYANPIKKVLQKNIEQLADYYIELFC